MRLLLEVEIQLVIYTSQEELDEGRKEFPRRNGWIERDYEWVRTSTTGGPTIRAKAFIRPT